MANRVLRGLAEKVTRGVRVTICGLINICDVIILQSCLYVY